MQQYLVVTFPTIAEAMHMKSVAKGTALAGRLAPVPRQLSAGCGFAWQEPLSNKCLLEQVLEAQNVEFEDIVQLSM